MSLEVLVVDQLEVKLNQTRNNLYLLFNFFNEKGNYKRL
jgi:hypothetical protein